MAADVLKQSSLDQALPLGSLARARVKAALSPRLVHGGKDSKGKRKLPRPFSPQAPVDLVLESKRAKGNWSLLHRKHRSKVLSMVYVYAARFQVRVYQVANQGDHLQLLVRAQEKKQLADFLRVLAGRIAITVTGARKHKKRIGKFWDHLCWSRLVNWGKDFFDTRQLILEKNLDLGVSAETACKKRASTFKLRL